MFGGEFPTGDIIPRFQALHVFVLPLVITGLIALHVAILVRQKHTQMPKPDVDGHTYIVGKPMWPGQFAESTTLFLWVGGLLAPERHGDSLERHRTARSVRGRRGRQQRPTRLVPVLDRRPPASVPHPSSGASWEPPSTRCSVAGAVIPGIMFGLLFAYPFIERKVYKLEGDWHVLDQPA